MKFFIVLLVVFLTSCSSSSKISLGNSPTNEGSTKFIIDDTKYYYGTRQHPYFFKFEGKDFSPAPKYVLDAELAKSLDPATDMKGIRLKKLTIYFGYAASEINFQSVMASGMGAAIGGGAGIAMMEIAASNPQTGPAQHEYPDNQIVGCDFMARYKGRIIELTINTPACDGGKQICFKRDSLGNLPLDDPELQKEVKSITRACIDKAIVQIEAMKDLPPLADVDQEKR